MVRMRVIGVLLLLGGTVVAGTEVSEAARKIAAITATRPLAPDDLRALERGLRDVPDEALTSDDPGVAAAFAALRFARGPGRALQQRFEIGLLHASDDPAGAVAGGRLLRRETFGDGFVAAAAALARDQRVAWRLEGGRALKVDAVFRGAGPTHEEAALALIRDSDVDLARSFVLWEAFDYRSPAVLDALVAALRDPRDAVREAARFRLEAELGPGRRLWAGPAPASARRGGRPDAAAEWRRRRAAGPCFGCDPARYDLVVDRVAVARAGQPRPVGPIWLLVESYSEDVQAGAPVFTALLAASRDPEALPSACGGSRRVPDGSVLRRSAPGMFGADPAWAWAACLAPDLQGDLRVRLRYWERRG